jgi:hypothetical protein
MALVALSMVSIIAMAALSIDIGTLYEAKAEAQWSADAAALAAARVISISGLTGDTGNTHWDQVCAADGPAFEAAVSAARQNLIGGIPVPKTAITVTYGQGKSGGAVGDCSSLGPNFAVNPIVTVSVQRTNLPIFFGRVFSLFGSKLTKTSVSATATAEAFNPSDSNSVAASGIIPVQPRCVKPLIIPNLEPGTGTGFVDLTTGTILNGKVNLNYKGTGVIGKQFTLHSDCPTTGATCAPVNNPPGAGQYVPALVDSPSQAVPSCASGNFQGAIAGCDQSTIYHCGTVGGAAADLGTNRGGVAGDTSVAAQCLINQSVGADSIDTNSFPFQINAGSGSPLTTAGVGVNAGDVVSTSNNIVTIPIYDGTALSTATTTPPVTIVGFLQVFIQIVNGNGDPVVTVLNVAGCGNGTNTTSSTPIDGTSPVPVRLITPP